MRIAPITILITAMLIFSPMAVADETEDIPTKAANTGSHDSLVAALTQAELVATLEGDGPFTVFAPTDQAFTDAGIDLAALDNEEGKATLTDILTYHVYVGSVASTEVTDGMTATMYNGDDVTFTVTDGVVKVGEANVTDADVMASNGIIHVIDKVLMPPEDSNSTQDNGTETDVNNNDDSTTQRDTSECDVIIGIDSTPALMGMAYDKTSVNVMVGDTVCWIWEDASMAHNVAQVDSATSTTRKVNGVYSGEAETTVDFRYTFTEDETFYYVCEPHIAQDMRGVITAGIGTVSTPEESNNTPGFGVAITMSALLLGLMFNSRKRDS